MLVFRPLLFLACLMLCWVCIASAQPAGDSRDQVWQVGARRWDVAEEQRFAAWVEQTITEDFFLKYNIPVDCADVPYAIRWIYARIAHLPAAATVSDGRLFGHWSTLWRHLPTNQIWYHDLRFRMALLYLLKETSTRTLPADTYPIRIAADSVRAGAVFIGDGHTGMVGRIVLDGSMFSPIQTWEATLPRKITKLRQGGYFAGWPDSKAGSGLVRFRWPVSSGGHWTYLPREEEPFYSAEQYSTGFWQAEELFDEAVVRRIDPTPYNPAQKAGMMMQFIHRYLLERVGLVHEGYRHCRRGRCLEGSSLWEMYSTPGRDDMIAFEIEHLLRLVKTGRLNESAIKKTMDGMLIPVDDKTTITLNYVVQNYLWMSHDPGDSIEARWALDKCGLIRARIQNTLQSQTFAEQRYRASDPHYADFSRSLRMNDLDRLLQEGRRAGCTGLPELSRQGTSLPVRKMN